MQQSSSKKLTKEQLLKELTNLKRKLKKLETNKIVLKESKTEINEKKLKQSKKALIESGQNYRSLIESSLDAIFVQQDDKIVLVNPAWEKLFGYSFKEICPPTGQAGSKPFDPLDIIAPSFKKLKGNKKTGDKFNFPAYPRFDLQGITKEGNIIDLEAIVTVINWNGRKAIQSIYRDITERKRIEEALRREAFIFDNLNDAVFITDLSGLILNWNSAATKMYGYTKNEVLQKQPNFLKNKKPNFFEKIIETVENEGMWIQETAFEKKDGTKGISETIIFPYLDAHGEKIALVGVSRDITEMVQYENILLESQKKYKDLTDLLPQTIFEIDLKGNLLFVNQAGFDTFKLTKQDVEKGLNVLQMLMPNERQKAVNNIKKSLRRKKIEEADFIALRKDGSSFPALVFSSVVIKKDKPVGLRGILIDITERKQIEEQLRKLSRAVEQSPNSIMITNILGDLEYVNPRFTELTGYLPEEVIGKNPRFLKSGETSDEEYKKMWDMLSKGDTWRGEFHNKRKNGELYWESVSISPIIDIHGRITHFLAIKEDMTERKMIEKELIKAKEKAEESDRLKSEFLAQMSHEIRSPINIILSYNSFIREELEGKLDSYLDNSFTSIDTAGKRLLRTLNLILNMAAVQSGHVEIQLYPVDLLKIISELIKEFEYSAKNKNLNLLLNVEAANSIIFADDYIVSEIFQNLIGNALKYTLKGEIQIRIYQSKNNLAVSVKDTGIGISEEYIPKLFHPFTQEETGYSRKYEGNGLGLALVKKYIELMNAEINVKSKKGIGSEFTVIFKQD